MSAKRLTSTERLFVDMLADLEHVSTHPNTYVLTRSSVALRQLLLQPNGVLQQVNREYRIRLRFPVNASELDPDELEFRLQGFGKDGKDGTLDQFIGQPCIWRHGYKYTVRDVIDICANKEGGAHLDKRLDARERTLLNMTWQQEGIRFSDGAYETPLHLAISQILLATIEALAPLRNAIFDLPSPVANSQPTPPSNQPPRSRIARLFGRIAMFLTRPRQQSSTQRVDRRAVIRDRRFHRERIELSTSSYENCDFRECRITYDGTQPVRMKSCNFEGCSFEMFGAALNTMRWFQSMYQSGNGGRAIVLNTMAEKRPDGSPRTSGWSDDTDKRQPRPENGNGNPETTAGGSASTPKPP
jgi:hypothetical protein